MNSSARRVFSQFYSTYVFRNADLQKGKIECIFKIINYFDKPTTEGNQTWILIIHFYARKELFVIKGFVTHINSVVA